MDFMELKLSKMCLISLSKYLWNFKDVKKQRLDFFIPNDWESKKDEWYNLTKEVLNYGSLLPVPKVLKPQLEDVIFFIGEEIYSWTEFLLKCLNLNTSFVEEVYFSDFGSIDEAQIFLKYWHNNEELFKNKEVRYDLYELACMFAPTDVVFKYRIEIIERIKTLMDWSMSNKKRNKIINDLKRKSNEFDKDDVVLILLVNYIFVRYKETYLDFDRNLILRKMLEQGYETRLDTKAALFEHCLNLRFSRTCKLFFSKFKGRLEDFYIFQRVLKQELNEKSSGYRKQKLTEITLYAVNNVYPGRKSAWFADHNQSLMIMTLSYWPYQEAFLNVFNEVRLFLSESDWEKILMFIAKQDEKDVAEKCPIKKNVNRVMFKKIWQQASQNVKKDRIFHRKLIQMYFEMSNFSNLKILLKSYLAEMDDTFFFDFHRMLQFEEEILNWIKEDKFALLNEFMELAFDDDGDRKKFLDTLIAKMVNTFHIDGVDLLILDKFFTWISSFDGSDVNLLKNKIRAKQAVDRMLDSGDSSDEVDKFLKWLYNSSDEKIGDSKNKLKSEDTAHLYIFHNISSPCYEFQELERKCNEFLKIAFNNSFEEIENFKLNVLIKDESSILDYCLVCDSNYEERFDENDFFPIENLLKFCGLPEEKVIELKKKCLDNVFQLMDSCASKCSTFVVLDHFLDWIVENKEEKKNLIVKFMKTENGIDLCNKMLNLEDSLHVSDQKVLFLNFYNNWIKNCENLSELRKKLETLNEENLTDAGKLMFLSMFDKLEKGEDLQFSDVLHFSEDLDESDEEEAEGEEVEGGEEAEGEEEESGEEEEESTDSVNFDHNYEFMLSSPEEFNSDYEYM